MGFEQYVDESRRRKLEDLFGKEAQKIKRVQFSHRIYSPTRAKLFLYLRSLGLRHISAMLIIELCFTALIVLVFVAEILSKVSFEILVDNVRATLAGILAAARSSLVSAYAAAKRTFA